jgi:serine/threonine protein kinase
MDTAALVEWMRQVGGALATAHLRGVIHNDVKPENVLVRRRDQGVEFAVTDFGLARLLDDHTVEGAEAGSLMYIAPELLDGVPPSVASDVYGLAATTCFLVNGVAPFKPGPGEPWTSLVRRVATEPVAPGATARMPEPLRRAVTDAMAKSPSQRPSLADLMAAAEGAVVAERAPVITAPVEVVERAPSAEERRPTNREASGLGPWWFALGLLVLFGVSVLVGMLFR